VKHALLAQATAGSMPQSDTIKTSAVSMVDNNNNNTHFYLDRMS